MRFGEQLELELDGPEPWNGLSPRTLTKGFLHRKLCEAARRKAARDAQNTEETPKGFPSLRWSK